MNRNSFEVFAAILNLAKEGQRKTKIMYHCNLGVASATKTLKFLVQTGLIAKNDNHYCTTDKGVVFIQKFQEIEKLLDTSGENANSHPNI